MKILDKLAIFVLGLTGGAALTALAYLCWHEFGLIGIVGFAWLLALSWEMAHFGIGVLPVPHVPKPKDETR